MDIYGILLLTVTFLLLVLADGCFLHSFISPIETKKSKLFNSIIWVGYSLVCELDTPSFHLTTIDSIDTNRPSVNGKGKILQNSIIIRTRRSFSFGRFYFTQWLSLCSRSFQHSYGSITLVLSNPSFPLLPERCS